MWKNARERNQHPRLVCPRCRSADDGVLSVAFLEAAADRLVCPRCHSGYPVIDGVPIVLRNSDTWTPETGDDAALTRIFGHRDTGPLGDRVDAVVRRCDGDILDMGCGGGALYQRRDVTAIDWSLAMARAHGPSACVADAADPPFEPARFDAVLLLNLLDTCANPRLVLAQADALLRRGGTLVVSCPYAWTDRAPVQERFSADELLAALDGDKEAIGIRLRYQIESVEDPVLWRLRLSPRLVQEYACQLVVARKAEA